MTAKEPSPEVASSPGGRYGPDGTDRRRRHRAKIVLSVQIRGGLGTIDLFEDCGMTIDASRDGLLVTTQRGGYSTGDLLHVRIASSKEPIVMVAWQRARVVRSLLMPDRHTYALGLEYQAAGEVDAKEEHAWSCIPLVVRVLLVESDRRAVRFTRNLLQQDGYEVVHVSDTEEALELLRTEIPDVVLADVDAGTVGGRELCLMLKKSARLRHIPVVLLMRSAKPGDFTACHEAGAVICMAMPCAPEKLQQALRLVAPPPLYRSSYSGQF